MIALAYPRKKAFTEGEVSFPNLQCWNPVTMVASIIAEVDGRRITCRIEDAVLKKKFHSTSAEHMQPVTEYRVMIETAARKLIENGRFEEDGSIMIRLNDL